jgi:uncharacterized protein YukE
MINGGGGDGFPYPQGDPAALEEAAGTLKGVAALLRAAASEMGSVAAQTGAAWSGPAATTFEGSVASVREGLCAMAGYHDAAADAVTTYATALSGFQQAATGAASAYADADAAYRRAMGALAAQPAGPSTAAAESHALDGLNSCYGSSYNAAANAVSDANQAALACARALSELAGQVESTATSRFIKLFDGPRAPLPSLLPPPTPGGAGDQPGLSPVNYADLLNSLYSSPATWALLRKDAFAEAADEAKVYQAEVSALLRAGRSEGAALPAVARDTRAALAAEDDAEELTEKMFATFPGSRVLSTSVGDVVDHLPAGLVDSLPDVAGKAADDLPLVGGLFAAGGATWDTLHGENAGQAVAGNAAGWITSSLTAAAVASALGPGGWAVAGGIVVGVGVGMAVSTVIEHPKAVLHFAEHVGHDIGDVVSSIF